MRGECLLEGFPYKHQHQNSFFPFIFLLLFHFKNKGCATNYNAHPDSEKREFTKDVSACGNTLILLLVLHSSSPPCLE